MICCKKCGTAKANGAEYCLFCGNKFPKVITPKWYDDGSVDVYLSGLELTFEPYDVELFDDVFEFSQECVREMSELIDVLSGSGAYFDNVFQKAIPCFFKLVLECAHYFYDWLYENGLNNIPEDTFVDEATNLFDIENDFKLFSNWAAQVNEEINKISSMRGAQRSSRSRWQGGGFGFKGAIKGAIQAGILNLGTDLIRGIGDSYIDSRDAKKIKDLKIQTGLVINPMLALNRLFHKYFLRIMRFAIEIYVTKHYGNETDYSKKCAAVMKVIQDTDKWREKLWLDKNLEEKYREAMGRLIVWFPFDPNTYINFIESGNGEPHEIETIINMNGMAEFVETGLYLDALHYSYMFETFFTDLTKDEKIDYLNRLGRIVLGCSNMHEEKKIRQTYYKYQEKMREMNLIK